MVVKCAGIIFLYWGFIIMKDKIELSGNVKSIVFRSQQNGYTVFKIEIENEDEVTCTGYFADINESEFVSLTGNFVMHPTYGQQFKVLSIEKKMPVTSSNIEKYLSSGIIKGIGPKIAKRIVDLFGDKTFDIIEHDFMQLTNIRGINKKFAEGINKIFLELNRSRNIMIYLQSLDITPAYIAKIQKHYGDDTINMLKMNPYRLTDEIWGIGFKKADAIAEKVGIEKDSPFRIQSAIKFCLKQAADVNGHTYLPENILVENAVQLINIDADVVKENILQMQVNNLIKRENLQDETVVYMNLYYYMEQYIAKKILLLNNNRARLNFPLDTAIKDFAMKNKIDLADNQFDAVRESIQNGITIITGGPGTGKTTTLKVVISLLKSFGFYIELCAPTGRAAKKMSESTNSEAKTIHRMLGINFADDDVQRFECDEDNPVKADYIVVDEASMIDISLMYNLLKATALDTKLILVGDADQLPSVGPGNILKDLIASKKIKVVRLDKIFRQASQSSIIVNAHKINKGEQFDLGKKSDDFFFIHKTDINSVIKTLVELAAQRIPKRINSNELTEIQVLTPMKKTELGTINLNKILQERFNPPSALKNERNFGIYNFREGDKVMQIKNDYGLEWKLIENRICIGNGQGVFNGDMGFIQKIDKLLEKITVKFDENKYVEYDFSQADELDLAYAITIHKSQGSEYKAIVMPIFNGPPMLMNRNLLYTGLTRAKNLAVIIGLPQTIYSMIRNKKKLERYSALDYRIQALDKFI